ncbi:MAG: diguanylate cyclase [Gemmatimonadales bacterium]|nr:MAG: diguanylate cyclase [Gemmatimonadales bacterium]
MPFFEPLSWLAADILAVILSVMTLAHLVRQRQEPGAIYLAWLAAGAGFWAALDLWMIWAPDLETGVLAARLSYVPQAVLALAWLGFALAYTGQEGKLRSGPAVLVGSLGILTVLLLVAGDPGTWLVQGGSPEQGAFGFEPSYGPWKRVHDGWWWGMVVFSTGVLALHVAQSPRHVSRLTFVLGAPILAAVASGLTAWSEVLPPWVNLQPLGMAMAGAGLGWGLLRFGEQAVAPVARNVVVEEMEDAVVVLDRRGRIVDVNRSARERLGLRLLGPVPIALGATWSSVKRDLGEAGMTVSERVELPVTAGQMHTFEMSATLLGPQGGRDRQVLVLRDITRQVEMERELSQARDSLERLANTDELTGLANRRSLLRQLQLEVDRAHRYQRPFSLVLLDLDHFKRVNDTYGHAAGDEVLRATARAMEYVSRDLDLPGRMGGEEFAVLLPETDAEGARVVADRLRVEIARYLHEPESESSFRVTASLGVATLDPGSELDVEGLMQGADEALYRAKEEGRNRVALSA